MSAQPITGNNVILYYHNEDDDTDVPFACNTDCQLTIQASVKEVTNYQSAFFRDFKADVIEWSVSGSGFTILNNQWNYFHIADLITNRTRFLIKFVLDNGGALGLSIFAGTVVVTNYQLSGTFDQLSTCSFQLQGCGAYSTSGTVVTPSGSIIISGTTLQVFQVTAVGSETSIVVPGGIGLDCVYASRGGSTIQALAFAGSPVPPVNGVWVSTTGQLNIPTDNAAGPEELFLLLLQ